MIDILNASPFGIAHLKLDAEDVSYSFVRLNPAFEKLTGWSEDECLGVSFFDLYLAHSHDDEWSALKASIESRANDHYECYMPRVNLWVQWNLNFEGGDLIVYLADITSAVADRKILQEERALFSEGPVFTVDWSPEVNWPIRSISRPRSFHRKRPSFFGHSFRRPHFHTKVATPRNHCIRGI